MFYSPYILTKKGPLGKVWLAAHFEKRLSKSQIFTTNITVTVDSIIHPKEPLSLRLSGQLMLGLVRIFSKKINYLYVDVRDIIWKIELSMLKPGYHYGTEGGRENVDVKQAEMNVDDPKFYGNVSAEMDYPGFDNIAFASPLLPSAISREIALPVVVAPTAAGVMPGELSMIDSAASIEFIRHDDRSSFLSASRASYAIEDRKPSSILGSATKFDDMVPVFEDKADFLFEEAQFASSVVTPPVLPPAPLPLIETPPAMLGEEPSPGVPTVSPIIEEVVVPGRAMKKRKIDERVDLSEEVYQQYLRNTRSIIRRPTTAALPYALGMTVEETLAPTRDFEERVFRHYNLCPELKELASIATNRQPFPFPPKEVAIIPESPPAPTEVARKGKKRETMAPTPESYGERVSPVVYEAPMMPEISFEAPRIEEFPLEEGGRPSLFKSFIEEEERRLPLRGSSEWVRTINDYVTQEASKTGSVRFSDLCRGGDRKFAARCFLEVLQLKTSRQIEVNQREAYGEIDITMTLTE